MEKLQIQSKDCIAENIQKIGELFPHCIVETKNDKGKLTKKIDFDLLQQELQNEIVGEDFFEVKKSLTKFSNHCF